MSSGSNLHQNEQRIVSRQEEISPDYSTGGMQEKYDGQSGDEDQLKQTNVTFMNDQGNPSGGNYYTQL